MFSGIIVSSEKCVNAVAVCLYVEYNVLAHNVLEHSRKQVERETKNVVNEKSCHVLLGFKVSYLKGK